MLKVGSRNLITTMLKTEEAPAKVEAFFNLIIFIMPNFNVYDKVVALSSSKKPGQQLRVKGCVYTVTHVMYCPKNGEQLINIDHTKRKFQSLKFPCRCGNKHNYHDYFAYTYSTEFVKLDDIEQRISEAVEEENYELAMMLSTVLEEIEL